MFSLNRIINIVLWGTYLAAMPNTFAWNYEGHRMVAAAAVAGLPQDFPEFARTPAASERIQFLSGEPDRWRILRDPALRHINEPDHYCDLESMAEYELTPESLPELRNQLLGKIYSDRAMHPEKFAATTEVDEAAVYLLFGLLPYSIHEYYLKLKSEFTYLRDMKNKGASPEDQAQAEQNIIYTMGVMSHFVGDGAQPLHLTVHHHGWVGANPNGYTTSRRIHSLIDGGYIKAANLTFDAMNEHVLSGSAIWPEPDINHEISAFPRIIDYLVETHRRVEPLYQLEKDKKFDELNPSEEGNVFIEEQILRGGQFLGSLYYSAYRTASLVPLAPPVILPAADSVVAPEETGEVIPVAE